MFQCLLHGNLSKRYRESYQHEDSLPSVIVKTSVRDWLDDRTDDRPDGEFSSEEKI